MKPKTIEHLQYFVGKVCTIITTQTNHSFDPKIMRDHYAVRVGEITFDGIWGVHLQHDIVSYFPMNHIVSIHEEIELDLNNPEHKKIVEEYEKQSGRKPDIQYNDEKELLPVIKKPAPVEEAGNDTETFVDINSLEQLIKRTKKTYDMSS